MKRNLDQAQTITPAATLLGCVYRPGPIVFDVPGRARPQGSKRAMRRGRKIVMVEMSEHLQSWRGSVAWAAQQQMLKRRRRTLLQGPIELVLLVNFKRPKSWKKTQVWPTGPPDSSKLLRAVEDALTGIVYRDDAQIVVALVAKHADATNPGESVKIIVREIA